MGFDIRFLDGSTQRVGKGRFKRYLRREDFQRDPRNPKALHQIKVEQAPEAAYMPSSLLDFLLKGRPQLAPRELPGLVFRPPANAGKVLA